MGGKSIEKRVMEEFHGYLPSRSEIHERINAIEDTNTRLYCTIAYAYGNRVEELVRYEILRQLSRQKAGNKWKIPNPKYSESIQKGEKPYLPSITPSNFQKTIAKNGQEYLVLTCRNLKNKTVHYKRLPVNTKKEGRILKFLLKWLENQPADKEIFPVNRRTIDRWIKQYAPFFRSSHFLRHLRCTHLINEYDFKESELKLFAGWTNTNPAQFYVHLNPNDLMERMR